MEEVKSYIEGNVGNMFVITTDSEKKKCESIRCKIVETYRSLFVVEVEEEDVPDKLRTYTYSDIYSKQVLIEKVD